MERCIDILKPNDLFDLSDFEITKIKIGENKTAIIETEEMETSDLIASDDGDDEESDGDFEEVPSGDRKEAEEAELRYLGFLTDKSSANARDYELELQVNPFKIDEENGIVVEIMRDLEKELSSSYLIKIKDWIKVRTT